MQRPLDNEHTPQSPVEPGCQAGPKPIDPADFKFIAGGAPRNGWDTAALVPPSTDSAAPRNGW